MAQSAKIRLAIAMLALGCAVASAASASDAVVITLTGEIAPTCGVASDAGVATFGSETAQTLALGAIGDAGSRAFSFGVSCNAAFTYRMISTNGGLKLQDAIAKPEGAFTDTAAYEVELSLPLSDGGSLNTRCGSADLLAGSTAACSNGNSGGRAAIAQTASATVRWSGEDRTRPRLAGNYSDVLVFRMTPTSF